VLNQKFKAMEAEMNQDFIERRDPIRGLFVGLVSGEHILFLGPPGTGKSAKGENLCSRIGGFYFRWLLSKTSTPEELFGPISLQALEQDSYRRVTTGKLPESNIAFLDEIFKCNSAVLNSMLSILNERLFFNDGQPVQVPLEMVIGASNELPEDKEELGALWDRFMLRYQVDYIKDPRNFERYLLGIGASATTTMLSMAELKQAQAEAAAVKVNKIIPVISKIRQIMISKGISVSDRRWKKCLAIIKANAWIEGRTEASEEDLEILAHALWQEPNQVAEIRKMIVGLVNPMDMIAQDLLDQAVEIYQEAMAAAGTDKKTAAGMEANGKLTNISQKLEKMKEEATAKGRSTSKVDEVMAQVLDYNKEVLAKCMGLRI